MHAMLRHLRVPELAFWVAAVVTLGAVLLVAVAVGSDQQSHAPGSAVVAVPSPERSQARVYVQNTIALMPAGVAAGNDPSAVAAWAQEIAQQANEGAKARAGEGADDDDALAQDFSRLAAQAAALQAAVADSVAVASLRTQIGLTAEHASALIDGMPAPDLPAGSLDPLGINGAAPTAPSPSVPTQPSMPSIPKENA